MAAAVPPIVVQTDILAQDLQRELATLIAANAQDLAAQCAQACLQQVWGMSRHVTGGSGDALPATARASHVEFQALDDEVRAALDRSRESPRRLGDGQVEEAMPAAAVEASNTTSSSNTAAIDEKARLTSPSKSSRSQASSPLQLDCTRSKLLAAVEEAQEAAYWKVEAEDEVVRLAEEFTQQCQQDRLEAADHLQLPPMLQSTACVWQLPSGDLPFPEVLPLPCGDLADELASLQQTVAAFAAHIGQLPEQWGQHVQQLEEALVEKEQLCGDDLTQASSPAAALDSRENDLCAGTSSVQRPSPLPAAQLSPPETTEHSDADVCAMVAQKAANNRIADELQDCSEAAELTKDLAGAEEVVSSDTSTCAGQASVLSRENLARLQQTSYDEAWLTKKTGRAPPAPPPLPDLAVFPPMPDLGKVDAAFPNESYHVPTLPPQPSATEEAQSFTAAPAPTNGKSPRAHRAERAPPSDQLVEGGADGGISEELFMLQSLLGDVAAQLKSIQSPAKDESPTCNADDDFQGPTAKAYIDQHLSWVVNPIRNTELEEEVALLGKLLDKTLLSAAVTIDNHAARCGAMT